MNPASPTYALGPYGFRPAPPTTVTTATTDGMCTAMAAALLPQVLGMSNSVVLDIIPVFSLDAYALIYVANAVTRYNGTVILQQATLYFDYTEAETITCVPMGTPITNLAYLKGPSQAEFGSANPYFAGAGEVAYDAKAFVPYSYSSYGSSSGDSTTGLREIVEGPLRLLYIGDRLMRVTRLGSGSDYEDATEDADEAADDLADDLDDL
jgi:hypothetical protein